MCAMTHANQAAHATHPITITLLAAMTLTSVLIGLHALGFQLRVSGGPEFHARFDDFPVAGSLHVIGGAVVLFTGALQFWPMLRRRWPGVHRWCGRVYLTFVLLGGLGALVLAPFSAGGVSAHFGFGILGVLWLLSGSRAYLAIRAGNVAEHRAWMMRNFAMTFAAVTLRIYLGLFAAIGVPFEEAYPTVAWLSWVPNLILVEWYLALSAAGLRRAA